MHLNIDPTWAERRMQLSIWVTIVLQDLRDRQINFEFFVWKLQKIIHLNMMYQKCHVANTYVHRNVCARLLWSIWNRGSRYSVAFFCQSFRFENSTIKLQFAIQMLWYAALLKKLVNKFLMKHPAGRTAAATAADLMWLACKRELRNCRL